MTSSLIPRGFQLAGLMNILGIPFFSLGFTNRYLTELYPEVFSTFGLIVIILWGLAYIAVAQSYLQVRTLIAVFAIEKLVYVISWVFWLMAHGAELPTIMANSPITGMFYVIYGLNDLLFGLFFAWVAWRQR
ncbi:MAG: hypothetical protein H0T73_02435 [Ardenticatenales bacterium]|nr:hypothetical protein [Ardenticatenales bacterium]